mmetsp:Transcript_96696/g.273465  ORF Transcript_96696/g.273465 Transcript_96696/m.273465 type:complete len:265 (+) Transcript_96696:133-927(+)
MLASLSRCRWTRSAVTRFSWLSGARASGSFLMGVPGKALASSKGSTTALRGILEGGTDPAFFCCGCPREGGVTDLTVGGVAGVAARTAGDGAGDTARITEGVSALITFAGRAALRVDDMHSFAAFAVVSVSGSMGLSVDVGVDGALALVGGVIGLPGFTAAGILAGGALMVGTAATGGVGGGLLPGIMVWSRLSGSGASCFVVLSSSGGPSTSAVSALWAGGGCSPSGSGLSGLLCKPVLAGGVNDGAEPACFSVLSFGLQLLK